MDAESVWTWAGRREEMQRRLSIELSFGDSRGATTISSLCHS